MASPSNGAEIGLGDEREHSRGVAQPRAIIGPRAAVALGVQSLERHAESGARARLVAKHREPSRKLGLGKGTREGVELGVREIAQIADNRPPVARKNIERIGDRRGIVLARLGSVDDLVAQPVERLLEGLARDGEIALPRARQKVGDEGVEPGVLSIAVGAPHAERAARALPTELALDRLFDPSIEIRIDAEMLDRREAIDVEQRHGDADRLLRTSIWVALQGRQQRRRVERAKGRG